MTSRSERSALMRIGTSALVILATVLGLVLMHSMVNGEHGPEPHTMSAVTTHPNAGIATTNAHAGSTTIASCGNACEMLCGLMGMACVMVLILTAFAWLLRPSSKNLFILSRFTAMLAVFARGLAPRRPVPLASLAVYRI